MHIGKSLGLKKVLIWSKRDILIFIIVAAVPTATYEFFHFQWLALPWLPMALIGTAVAIIIGFQDNATYDRFWEARKIYGSIVNSSRTWGMLVQTYISNNQAQHTISDNEMELIHRRLIYRHIAWLTALRHQLRQTRGWEAKNKKYNIENSKHFIVPEHHISLEDDIDPFLSIEDKEYILSKTNRAAHIIKVQSEDLKNLLSKGFIENFRYIELQRILSDFYEYQGKCERIKNFPYPRQFASLNLYFVWIFIFLLPFGMLPEFEKLGHHITWLTIPFCVIVSWVFRTMDKIGESTENPFQAGSNDIPISSISRNIEIDLLEMLNETNIPKPIESANNILM
ncbi:multidrug transporter [Nitrosomonas sp. JL21]|uniref:bestrophin family protein n=1 Tax=Nitrosomonas sp. JL21 TaxID=153949 RepID=UPI00136B1B67|nr:bestrophin family ion channel [Nitrosomonas sp. JL21]MXS78819.1 multidrug transporter [Nitrosomonas sp. JL21]